MDTAATIARTNGTFIYEPPVFRGTPNAPGPRVESSLSVEENWGAARNVGRQVGSAVAPGRRVRRGGRGATRSRRPDPAPDRAAPARRGRPALRHLRPAGRRLDAQPSFPHP